MAITSTDLEFVLTNPSLSSHGGGDQPDPNASLGKYASTRPITTNVVDNLFDDVGASEQNVINYRCIGLHNKNATLTFINSKVWITKDTVQTGEIIELGVASSPVIAQWGSSSPTFSQTANETTAPTPTINFSQANSEATALTIGDVPAGYVAELWIKRTMPSGTFTAQTEQATLNWKGETNP